MLMATRWSRSTLVKSSSVNWLPWSVLKISGRPLLHSRDAKAGVEQV
jgi:hypothetical protein